MKAHFLTTITASVLVFSACQKRNIIGIVGKGEAVTETRTISDFDRIKLSCDADIDYTQDSLYYVEVRGQKNILEVLELRHDGNTLEIDFRKNVWKHDDLRLIIHSPHISGFSISGSGDIRAMNALTSGRMELRISGSGNIQLPSLQANSLEAKISGSGNIGIDGGTISSQELSISGSGDMRLIGLSSDSGNCRISGSGDIELWVNEDLDVSISGSGDVRYKGRPRINSSISGSGTLKGI